jgi:hypothetical protein
VSIPSDSETIDARWRPSCSRGFDSDDYDGTFSHRYLPPVEEPDFGSEVLGLNAQGTQFIARYRPESPIAQFGQFLIELHQLPQIPRFLLRRAKYYSDLGAEYLNVEFGWRPFVKDVKDAFSFQQRFQERYNRLCRENGLPIRKRDKHVLTDTTWVSLCEGSLNQPFGKLDDLSIGGNSLLENLVIGGPLGSTFDYNGSDFHGQCDYKLEERTVTDAWNCGTFFYYVPDLNSEQWTDKAKKMLSGVNLTPALLYDVYPWSWLLNWFTNAGQVVHNLSDDRLDNELLTNCYAMFYRRVERRVTISLHWDEVDNGTENAINRLFVPAGGDSFQYLLTKIEKYRHQASPFGFGVPREAFSAKQWAILAALWISGSKPWRNIHNTTRL